jgi:hypothetical protein
MFRRCPRIDPTPPYEAGRRSSKVARTFDAISGNAASISLNAEGGARR